MRDHYAGDISDFLKFSYLRALRGSESTLGIAWYYVSGVDNELDGRHLEWCEEPQWQQLDPELHEWLSAIAKNSRTVSALQDSKFWGSTVFHSEEVPPQAQRNLWALKTIDTLKSANLVFLDPDNGIGKFSQKHASFAEIKLLLEEHRAIAFITFPKRQKHNPQLEELHKNIREETGATSILTLRTSVSVPSFKNPKYVVPRARWFTLVNFDPALQERLKIYTHRLDQMTRVRASLYGD